LNRIVAEIVTDTSRDVDSAILGLQHCKSEVTAVKNSQVTLKIKLKRRKWKLTCQKRNLKGQSGTKLPEKLTSNQKMAALSSFLETSINFLSNNLKKHYKIWYSHGKKWCQSLNCQKHSLKRIVAEIVIDAVKAD